MALSKTNIKTLIQNTLIKFYTDIFKPDLENHTHNYAGSSEIGGAANSSIKLTTLRAVKITEGLHSLTQYFNGTENLTIPVDFINEAYIQSGGKNLIGKYSPIDASMVPELGANRLAFVKDNSVTIESSIDGGTTWNTVTVEKPNILFSGCSNAGIYIGNDSSISIDKSKYMIRFTIDCSAAPLYSVLNKFIIFVSTNGSTGCYCTIQGKTNENANTDTWTTYADKIEVKGWSGYNVINTTIVCGGTGTDQNKYLRFIFGVTSHDSSIKYSGLQILKIMGFGGVGWQTPSWLAGTGNIYKYDANQNATFPNKVTAEEFSGKVKMTDVAGVLPIDKGGTGRALTKTPNALLRFSGVENYFSTIATKNGALYASEDNGTANFGILPIAQGGTGSTTVDEVRENISVYSKSETDEKFNSHTHNYAGSSSAGGSATSAEKLSQSRTLTIGNAEKSFDGSSNVSWTLSEIGAAKEKHTHDEYDNPGFSCVIVNESEEIIAEGPNEVIAIVEGSNISLDFANSDYGDRAIRINNAGVRSVSTGSTNGTVSVDMGGTTTDVAIKGLGSAAYTNSNAYATSGHTHNYAGSSSVGGSATSADKVNSSLTIQTNGTSAAVFDGSVNKTVNITPTNIGALPLSGGTLTGKLILNSNSGLNMANGVDFGAYDTEGNAITLATLTPLNIARFGTTKYETYISTSGELRVVKDYDSSSDGYGNLRIRNIYFRNTLDDSVNHLGKIESDSTGAITLSSTNAVILKGHSGYTDSTNCGLEYKRITNSSNSYPVLRPLTTGLARLGTTSLRWQGIYSATAVDVGSDRRLKEDIININENLENMFMELRPVIYKLKENDDHRIHSGFIAQEVEESMNNNNISYEEFAALNKSMPDDDVEPKFYTEDGEPDYEYSLKYTEFIPLNTHMIQKAFKRIEELEKRILELESK